MPSIRLVAFLTSRALVATLRAATRLPAENPVAAPAAAGNPHAVKDPISVESLGDSPVSRRNGFELFPAKIPTAGRLLSSLTVGRSVWQETSE